MCCQTIRLRRQSSILYLHLSFSFHCCHNKELHMKLDNNILVTTVDIVIAVILIWVDVDHRPLSSSRANRQPSSSLLGRMSIVILSRQREPIVPNLT
mmetsp:Transcript_6691/g.9942  ORF Transcript_6691/g.9942 Transcript_6691/m.9942 type:complete len:97 (+) Transcript_6691:103-393(+)